MVGKQYQPLPTSDRAVSAFCNKINSHLFYLTWCLIVELGGGEKGDTHKIALLLILLLLLILFTVASCWSQRSKICSQTQGSRV